MTVPKQPLENGAAPPGATPGTPATGTRPAVSPRANLPARLEVQIPTTSTATFGGFHREPSAHEVFWGDVALLAWVLAGTLAIVCVIYRRRLSLALPTAVAVCLALGLTGTLIADRQAARAWTAPERPSRFHALVLPRYFNLIAIHVAETGRLPANLDSLRGAVPSVIVLGRTAVPVFLDAWERPLAYAADPATGTVTLTSAGLDARFGTDDDRRYTHQYVLTPSPPTPP